MPSAVKTPRFDIVFYAPWAGSLVGAGSAVEAVAGGGETQQFLLAQGLAARGLTVGMIVMGRAGELPSSVRGVHILPQRPRGRLRGPAGRLALALGALESMARARASTLVQRNAGATTAVAAVAARLSGARFVYSAASMMDFEFDAFEESALNVRMYEWGLRHAAQVVVQTDEQAQLCRTRYGREPIVIGSIGDRPQQRSGRPEAFLWVGKFQPVKRPEPYLDLARALPEAEFWMVATPGRSESPALRTRVEAAARDLANLKLLEPRSRDGIGELLERTVAVVNTSEREGMPNIFLEGWSRGVPALALSFDPGGFVTAERLGSFADGDPRLFEEQARALWHGRHDQGAVAERCMAHMRTHHSEDAVIDRWVTQALFATVRGASSTS